VGERCDMSREGASSYWGKEKKKMGGDSRLFLLRIRFKRKRVDLNGAASKKGWLVNDEATEGRPDIGKRTDLKESQENFKERYSLGEVKS